METKVVRKNIRLKDFDYTSNEAYFITIVVDDRSNYFGTINKDKVKLNKYGEYLESMLIGLPKIYTNTEVYDYVIMPNHLHAVILLQNSEERKQSLDYIIGRFKSYAANELIKFGLTGFKWQTRFLGYNN